MPNQNMGNQSPKTLIYQLYPTSWGNFAAMSSFLPRIKALDADYVWLCPIFPSTWSDGGYDITNYEAVDPRFGTMDDFDAFVEHAHSLGIKVLLDLVLNHTSIEHPWFQSSARQDPKYKDYYIWTEKDYNWKNLFDKGPAFEYHEGREQFYLHIFNEFQPDLNWENPSVMIEFQNIIDFWTEEHHVDGFRLDVCQFLSKRLRLEFLPTPYPSGFFNYFGRPRTVEILHKLFKHRDHLFTVGEAGSTRRKDLEKFVKAFGGPLSAVFNTSVPESIDKLFNYLPTRPSLGRFKKLFDRFEDMPGYALALESHDTPRFTSRAHYSSKSILSLMFNSSADIICLYQGQELGTRNPELPNRIDDYSDCMTIMQYERAIQKGELPEKALAKLKPHSRDNARQAIDLDDYALQENLADSCLAFTKRLIADWRNGHPAPHYREA